MARPVTGIFIASFLWVAAGCVPAGDLENPGPTGASGAGGSQATGALGGAGAAGGARAGTGGNGSGIEPAGGASGGGAGHSGGSGSEAGAEPAAGTGGGSGQGGSGGAAPLDAAEQPPPDGGATGVDAGPPASDKRFSFFVTSIEAMRELSGSQDGFGGDLGGLAGADEICRKIAEKHGAGHKTWRAFLSATRGEGGGPVHAIDRIGDGPWYDRNERLVAENKAGLIGTRPDGDRQAAVDLVNERGELQKPFGDNHDVITGSDRMGRLASPSAANTCQDWTFAEAGGGGRPMCGHSWSRGSSSQSWLSQHTVPGCAPGVHLRDNSVRPGNCIGCNGGYGALYCFALTP